MRLASRVKGPVAVKKPLSMSLFRRFLPQPRNAYMTVSPSRSSSRALFELIFCFFEAAAELSGCHFWVTRLHPRLIPVGRPLALVPFIRARSSVGLIGWAGEPTGSRLLYCSLCAFSPGAAIQFLWRPFLFRHAMRVTNGGCAGWMPAHRVQTRERGPPRLAPP